MRGWVCYLGGLGAVEIPHISAMEEPYKCMQLMIYDGTKRLKTQSDDGSILQFG